MYMSQHQFTPDPAKYELWLPYNRNYMTVTSRAPGAVLSRILRLRDQPERFFAIGIWESKAAAVAWTDCAESRLAAKPSVDQGLYDGFPMDWSRWTLRDFAWGLAGPEAHEASDLFVRHVAQPVEVADLPARLVLERARLSLLARQPGFVSGETYIGHRGDSVLTITTFESAEAAAPEALPAELRLLRDGSRSPLGATSLDCTLFQSVWGPAKADLRAFVGGKAA
jgi:heme-degrading monooxygenase HmoA